MKQILQNLKTGAVVVTDVPAPVIRPGFVMVRTAASLISAGTERMTVETGQKSLVGRAFDQPALVKQVIQKARTEGVMQKYSRRRKTCVFVCPHGLVLMRRHSAPWAQSRCKACA